MAQLTNVDVDAVEIGERYRRFRKSVEESMQEAAAIGEMLLAKKKSLKHGEWISWLDAREELLGFDRFLASRFIRAAEISRNGTFEPKEISRIIWGNTKRTRVHQGAEHQRVPTKSEQLRLHFKAEIEERDTRIAELQEELSGNRDFSPIVEKSSTEPEIIASADALENFLRLTIAVKVRESNLVFTDYRRRQIGSRIANVRACFDRLLDLLEPEPPKRKRKPNTVTERREE